MVRRVRCVGGGVREHGVDRCNEWLQANQTREHGFVSDRVLEDERRPLIDLVSEKLGRAGFDARFDFRGFGPRAKLRSSVGEMSCVPLSSP